MDGITISLIVVGILIAVMIGFAAARRRRHPPSSDFMEAGGTHSPSFQQGIQNMRDGRR